MKRFDLDIGSAGREASVQPAHLGVDFGELAERLGDRTRLPSVVDGDQASRFLGESLRSREIGGELSVTLSRADACEFASSPSNALILASAISAFVAARPIAVSISWTSSTLPVVSTSRQRS